MVNQSAVLENDVPERPTRAPGIELSGEMEDSAYEDRPWLILRDGTFVRVTELLYRVAEAADGTRDIEGVAGTVSEATGRSVSPDNIRTLVRDRLIPLGLIPKADGSVVESPGGDDGRSPIQIGMRSARLPSRFVEPVANAFKALFVPPLVIGVLAVGLAAVGWLFFVHGVGPGFRSAVQAPWLVLVLLPLVIASAAFHELGHAAALAYGGGKVRGMGAGFFTAYPVFYTDVTDNYRLKRWSRVRTDLGGFHFNLIFAAAVTGVYLATGLEFLLLLVLAIVASIVQQSMPLVRLDGYWALADMTGIPDPTAAIGPAVRSVLPLPRSNDDDKAPKMKRWAKAALLLWTAIAIPVLILLLLYMLASAPRIIGTGVQSFGTNAAALGDAASRGDLVSGLAAIVSIAVLILTTVAFVWFVVSLIKGVMNRLWGWAGDDRRRRVVAGAGTLGMVALLAYLWAPPLPITGGRPGPFHDFRPLAAGERLTMQEALQPLLARVAGTSGSGTPSSPGTEPATPGSAPGVDVPNVGEPPDVEPPVVDPPVDLPDVDPPAVDPPVDVPDVDPPAIDPPAVDPPTVDPPAVEPPAVDPPAVDPPDVTSPLPDLPAVDPPAVEPPAVDPTPVEPPAVEPSPVNPSPVQPPSLAPSLPPSPSVVPLP